MVGDPIGSPRAELIFFLYGMVTTGVVSLFSFYSIIFYYILLYYNEEKRELLSRGGRRLLAFSL